MTEEDWLKQLAKDIEADLRKVQGVGVPRYIIGIPYPTEEIDKQKIKPETDQGIW